MNIKKPLLVLGAVTGIGLAGVTGLGVASAATDTGKADTIIEKIAVKFNLDKGEVEAVFEEDRAAREAERQQKTEDRLSEAVKDGELTEEQKTKILAKLEELKAVREEWRDKAPEDRRDAKMELHQSLEQWAKDNNVPLRYLMIMHGAPHQHPHMMKGENVLLHQ